MAAIGSIIMTCNLHYRMTVKPRAVLPSIDYKMRVPYKLKQGQSRHFHKLPSGLNMEFIVQKGLEKNVEKCEHPPLVFVHGSFHAAWCWAEHWFPFFSEHGFDCYALSLLSQVFNFPFYIFDYVIICSCLILQFIMRYSTTFRDFSV